MMAHPNSATYLNQDQSTYSTFGGPGASNSPSNNPHTVNYPYRYEVAPQKYPTQHQMVHSASYGEQPSDMAYQRNYEPSSGYSTYDRIAPRQSIQQPTRYMVHSSSLTQPPDQRSYQYQQQQPSSSSSYAIPSMAYYNNAPPQQTQSQQQHHGYGRPSSMTTTNDISRTIAPAYNDDRYQQNPPHMRQQFDQPAYSQSVSSPTMLMQSRQASYCQECPTATPIEQQSPRQPTFTTINRPDPLQYEEFAPMSAAAQSNVVGYGTARFQATTRQQSLTMPHATSSMTAQYHDPNRTRFTPAAVASMSDSGETKRVLEIVHPPQNLETREGDNAIFNAVIKSTPAPVKVTWMHDNKSLMASNRYRTYFDGQLASLVINSACEYDEGMYRIIAESRDGCDAREARLQITAPKIYNPPQFMQRPLQPVSSIRTSLGPTHEIDSRPVIDPSSFKHLERRLEGSKAGGREGGDGGGGIDQTSFIPAEALQQIERSRMLAQLQQPVTGPVIDDRPIVNIEAIKALEERRINNIMKTKEPKDYSAIYGSKGRTRIVGSRSMRALGATEDKLSSYGTYDHPSARTPTKTDNVSEIDTRPIVDPHAFRYLENPRADKQEDPNEPLIDTRPIVDPSAFRYLEKPTRSQTAELSGNVIDTSPIVDPAAFKYLYISTGPVHAYLKESTIDCSPIVNPEAFRYLERSSSAPREVLTESTVDKRPFVDPKAFRYIEPRVRPVKKDLTPIIDTSSILDQSAFKHLDPLSDDTPRDTAPEIDTTSMIPSDALKYIERPPVTPRHSRANSPGIDDRAYVNSNKFRYLELPEVRPVVVQAGIDDSSYIPSEAFRGLEAPITLQTATLSESTVDITPMISPEAFIGLESKTTKTIDFSGPQIDDSPHVNLESLRQLEQRKVPESYEEQSSGIPPSIQHPLSNCSVSEGQDIYLAACVKAAPLPEINWLKDNQALIDSSRIIQHYDLASRTATLRIRQSVNTDRGTYTMLARNPYGQVSCSSIVAVQVQPTIDQTNFVPLEHIRDVEISSARSSDPGGNLVGTNPPHTARSFGSFAETNF